MKVIIVGANFNNKGAQSMLFTTVAAIRQRYRAAEIFFAHNNATPSLDGNFLFNEIYYNNNQLEFLSNEIKMSSQNVSWDSPEKTFQIMEDADLIIDISGFALSNKFGRDIALGYLKTIKLAHSFKVPMILMPQSFGPFEFGDIQKIMDALITDALSYPEKIFAREREGFVYLRDKYHIKRASVHPDLVLSSPEVKLTNIYKTPPKISVPKVLPTACVGVVPNMRGFDRPGANPWQTLQAYYEIIDFLLKSGKLVYLFRHSIEDIVPCTWLKSLFANDVRVVLWQNDFSCFEYDAVCRQFDFLIVGRFHGIVHAYRNNVPCLLMGWAVKYRELAQLMYQSRYIFDLAVPNLDMRKIFSAIHDIDNNLELNKKILRERLAQVQESGSCFSAVTKILDKVAGRRS